MKNRNKSVRLSGASGFLPTFPAEGVYIAIVACSGVFGFALAGKALGTPMPGDSMIIYPRFHSFHLQPKENFTVLPTVYLFYKYEYFRDRRKVGKCVDQVAVFRAGDFVLSGQS